LRWRPLRWTGGSLKWGVGVRDQVRTGHGETLPFSAHRYLDFQGEQSHVTLARGETEIAPMCAPMSRARARRLQSLMPFAIFEISTFSNPSDSEYRSNT
jgi:hypothetical protein